MDTSASLNATLYDLFLRFNRRYLAIGRIHPSPLAINESHILAEIAQPAAVTAKQISSSLNIEKSTLSRILASLAKRNFLEWRCATHDHRWKELHLTAPGLVVLSEDCRQRNVQTQLALQPLNADEQEALRSYHQRIADALQSPAVHPFPEESSNERQLRRMTRGLGFLGSNCLGTNLPPHECQILAILGSHSKQTSLGELAQAFPCEISMLSRMVSALEKRAWVTKQASVRDRRRVELSLAASGCERQQAAESAGGDFIVRALRSFTPGEINEFAELHARLHRGPALAPEEQPESSFHIKLVSSDKERFRARAFIIEQLVKAQEHHHAPAGIVDGAGICHTLTNVDLIYGVAESQKVGSEWALRNFRVLPELSHSQTMDLLQRHLRFVLRQTSSVVVTRDSPAFVLLRQASLLPAENKKYRISRENLHDST